MDPVSSAAAAAALVNCSLAQLLLLRFARPALTGAEAS
jgi:hypothetical protein